jgi:hypothetical protein
MPDDREEPSTLIPATEARVEPPRAQIRLLHHVLRVVLVAQKMSRKRVRVIEERDDVFLEAIVEALAQCSSGTGVPTCIEER